MKTNSLVRRAIHWVRVLVCCSWQHGETGYIVTLPFYKIPSQRYYRIRRKHIQDLQRQPVVSNVREYDE